LMAMALLTTFYDHCFQRAGQLSTSSLPRTFPSFVQPLSVRTVFYSNPWRRPVYASGCDAGLLLFCAYAGFSGGAAFYSAAPVCPFPTPGACAAGIGVTAPDRVFPSRRVRESHGGLAVLAGCALTYVPLDGPEKLVRARFETVIQYINLLPAPTGAWLPSWWLTQGWPRRPAGRWWPCENACGFHRGGGAVALRRFCENCLLSRVTQSRNRPGKVTRPRREWGGRSPHFRDPVWGAVWAGRPDFVRDPQAVGRNS